MTARPRRALLPCLLALTALGAGCAETRTVRELGHPEFEAVVGAETRFTRADEKQVGAVDAFPDGAEEGDHRFLLMFLPDGDDANVVLTVRVGHRPPTGLPLSKLGVAVYALAAQDVPAYERSGKVPAPEAPITARVVDTKDPQGGLAMRIEIPRAAIPAGTAKLACPLLVRFEDGWVHLRYYQTGVPAVVPRPAPEELMKLRSVRDLGHPQFEDLLGAEARYQRADLSQTGAVDALPETAEDADHHFKIFTQPSATADEVRLDVRVGQRPPAGLPLDLLATALYPLTPEQSPAFAATGALPAPGAPPLVREVTREVTPDGVLHHVVAVKRAALPAGCDRLAAPILVRFRDGWIHIHFLEVQVPPP